MEAVLQSPFGRMVLGPGVMTIGRARDNQLVVNDATASSHHAEIRPADNGYRLTDLSSTNGTFVNERKLNLHTPHLLQSGDSIRIGNTTFIYEAGSSALRGQLVQESSLDDEPTVQWRASKYKANDQSEKWGYQSPTNYSTYTSQQQPGPAPFPPASQQLSTPPPAMDAITGYGMPERQPGPPSFPPAPPAFQQSNMPPWAMERATSYAMPEQQLAPAPFPPSFQQPNMPPWAMERASGYAIPVQQQPYTPLPVNPKSKNRLKVLLIVLSVLLVLGAGGGGIAAYMLTRPQPVMTVTSTYRIASIPAGSTGTVLHISARSFSGSSAITFLLDNAPVVSGQQVSSDANGNVRADLTITTAWAVGNHTLTAKDASGYTTKVGMPIAIVPQGQAHTPGPHGAPPDDMSFTLNASLQAQDAGTGQQLGSTTETLTVTGKPDPSGGTVCQSTDDGQIHTYNGSTSNGITYRETYVLSCSGTYKGGKLSYIETATSDKVVFSNGVSCVARTPYVYEHLEGTFTSQNTLSGTFTSDSITVDCDQNIGTHQTNARKGSWTAQM